MDEKLALEIDRIDPTTPFRATSKHTHHTWARTFTSHPELYIRPRTLAEIRKVVRLAQACRRRVVVVGCGHSPSDLTCTSSWLVNLDHYARVVDVDRAAKRVTVEGGIRLRQLNAEANRHGLTMPNLGSIDVQSIAGAMATATHGSSLWHGLLSDAVRSLKIVLADGRVVQCSATENRELFSAALVSLGALGIVVEVEFQMIDACNIEWTQTLRSLDDVLDNWNGSLWRQKEYTRIWWMPYMKRAIVWSAEKTEKAVRAAEEGWYGGSVGFHTYHNLLWLSNYVPSLLPWIEWFVFGMQYGFRTGATTSAVEPLQKGLLLNCLYSQFVNEWALPLSRGPEAITRLSAWLNRESPAIHRIPFSNKSLYVHCPIEVRVSDTTVNPDRVRPLLDNTCADGPTLYLNATLYRPHLQDPPCRDRYYEAFEWLMQDLGGKPHYAKNFLYVAADEFQNMLGDGLQQWARIRNEVDPEGMFVGEWHRRNLGLGGPTARFALEEREIGRFDARDGGKVWVGEVAAPNISAAFREESVEGGDMSTITPTASQVQQQQPMREVSPSASSSTSSFDMMHGSEAERSLLWQSSVIEDEREEEDEGTGPVGARHHGNAQTSWTGTKVFDKM
jgi:D-arabinono-1,4-lactone oxidase